MQRGPSIGRLESQLTQRCSDKYTTPGQQHTLLLATLRPHSEYQAEHARSRMHSYIHTCTRERGTGEAAWLHRFAVILSNRGFRRRQQRCSRHRSVARGALVRFRCRGLSRGRPQFRGCSVASANPCKRVLAERGERRPFLRRRQSPLCRALPLSSKGRR